MRELDAGSWLRRFRLLGIIVPLVSIIALHLLMTHVLDRIWPQHTVAIGWVIGALGLFVFALCMSWLTNRGHRLLEAQNQARLEVERKVAVLEERERIAREMHDSLAQVLGLSHLKLRAMAADPEAPEHLRAEMDLLADTCHMAYADVREAILGLRQHVDGERSLLDCLDDFLRSFSRTTGLTTRLEVTEGLEPELSPTSEVQLLRIVQESLTNVRKHAGATTVRVEVTRPTEGRVQVAIVDDGHGFDPSRLATPSADGGFGLSSMRERTEAACGILRIHSRPGSGTRVEVEVPEGLFEAVCP